MKGQMTDGTRFSYTHTQNYKEKDGYRGTVSATVIGVVTKTNAYNWIEWERVEVKDVVNEPSWGFDGINGGACYCLENFPRTMLDFTIL